MSGAFEKFSDLISILVSMVFFGLIGAFVSPENSKFGMFIGGLFGFKIAVFIHEIENRYLPTAMQEREREEDA